MSDSLVITALLKHYKSQGIDLYHVLDDPLFSKLPLETKIEAVKANAAHIVEGSRPSYGMSASNILKKVLSSSLGGALTGMTINMGNSLMSGRSLTPGTFKLGAGIGSLAGALTGAVTGVLDESTRSAQHDAMIRALREVEKTPSFDTAVGALSASRAHGLAFDNTRKLVDGVSRETSTKVNSIMPAVFDLYHQNADAKALARAEAAAEAEYAAAQDHLDSLNK